MSKKEQYAWRHKNVGRVMNSTLHRFEDRVMELMNDAGYTQTRAPHINLTRHLDLDGTRITILSQRAAMTNAAMTELIDQCELLGLVKRHPDPTDKRARIVRFTPQGLEWLNAFGKSLKQSEKEMAAEIGQEAFRIITESLYNYGATDDSIEDF